MINVARLTENRWRILFSPGNSLVRDKQGVCRELSLKAQDTTQIFGLAVGEEITLDEEATEIPEPKKKNPDSALAVSNVEGYGSKSE